MGIFRSTNPTEFDAVDGIVINESAPAPNIKGVSTNIVILVGQFQRGPLTLTEVSSIGELHEIFGKSNASGNAALKNKKFSRLRIVRAAAAAAATATATLDDGADTDIIKFDAKQGPGAYGNSIQVKIEAGTTAGKKYTITDTNSGSVMLEEIYDDVLIANVVANKTFANSKLVTATVLATTAQPANQAATGLASGSDGTIADTDYQAAIARCEIERAGNILFLDSYNATRNGYLKSHAAEMQDKMCILAGPVATSVASSITAVANLRDADGRLIYAFPWVKTVIDGVEQLTCPASWYASLLSQTGPHVDPAFAANTQFLSGITGLEYQLKRSEYIQLMNAGISAFEYDSDIGYKIKSGVVTQISNSSKIMVFRRRMADYLTDSAGLFLKNYQNGVNSKENRTEAGGGIKRFVKAQEDAKILPKDADVASGKAKLIDTESLNTNDSIAAGYFRILWKQRIFSSNRFIVLQAEIGESVVVTEGE